MHEQQENEVPPAVMDTLKAIVSRALAECAQRGIALEDFYRALLEEEKASPKVTVSELFDRTFRRLKSSAN